MTLNFKSKKSRKEIAFQHIAERYYDMLYRFAYSLVSSQPEAFDLTQQTFFIWAQKGHQLRDPTKIKTWLFTTLRREFLRSQRNVSQIINDNNLSDENIGSLETLDDSPEIDACKITPALEKMSEFYRTPLILFYMREHSYQEIADILEVPIGTVKSRISRGKALLYRYIKIDRGCLDNGMDRVGAE